MLLALDGPDGAGKSTQVRRIIAWARSLGLSARTVGKWEIFEEAVAPEGRFLRGTDLMELRVCIAEMPSPARMLFLGWLNTMAAQRARLANEDLVILDGYWINHAASELVLGCNPGLVHAITAAMPPADLIVYVDVRPEEALRRKQGDLTPYECGRDPACDPGRFLSHQAAMRQVMLEWASTHAWAVVMSGAPDATEAEFRALLLPRLMG